MNATLSLFSEAPRTPPPVPLLMVSSREIAKVTEKRHDHVVRDIQTMLEAIHSPELGNDDSKEVVVRKDYRGFISEILLSKLLVMTLLTGYRPDLRYKMIVRLEELERNQHKLSIVDLTDPVATALALAEQYQKFAAEYQMRKKREEEIAVLEKLKAVLTPKAQIADRIAEANGLHTMIEAAKILQTGRTRLFVLLRMKRIFMSDGLPYQRYIELGYFVVKEKTYQQNGSEHLYSQPFVTGKGLTWLARLIDDHEGSFPGEEN